MGGLRHLAALALATGCHFATNPVQDGASGDAVTDDGSPLCFGNSLERVCLARMPTGVFEVGSAVAINTDASQMCEPLTSSTVDACVIAGMTVDVDDRLTAVGSRPLVLLSLTHLVIGPTGYVDASSSHLGMPIGSGANPALCPPLGLSTGGAGGAGGSFTGRGGTGGAGTLGMGGVPAPPSSATMLRGGCSGGVGSGQIGASAGAGGGAVDLIAGEALMIGGIVDASGAGGSGGAGAAGGGGGAGSGGMIGLVAKQVQITASAQLFANGGGGGGAGTDSMAGGSGADPTMATVPAPGGISVSGSGGDGSAGQAVDGADGSPGSPAGGGGGGGAGVIALDTPSLALSGTVSPGLTRN
jgi:hypothetical protein